MNAKRLSLVLVVVLVALLAVQMRTYAQGGPSFTVSFNPEGSTQVGQSVKIHVKVNASTYGASKITVSCGGVSKVETSEIEYDSTWSTNGCSSGGQSVLVCAKTAPDEQWQQANCQQFGYGLTGSNPNIPNAQFWADTGNLQLPNCTTMHWRVSGATSVNIDGANKDLNGDERICPTVTTKYSLSATGPGGTAYLNFSVTVTTAPQPQSQGPTNSTSNDQRNIPSQPGRPTLAQARQQGTPGGVDVVVYCAAKGYGGPSNAPDNSANAAYSWKCGNVSLGDFTQVCRDVYGDSFHPVNVMGANRLGGWRCVQGGNANSAPAKPQLPANCSGVLPPHLVIGQKATVTQEGDGHNLRTGNGLNEPIRGNLRVGDVVVVIGGPRCTDGYQWWQLQTANKGTWWAAEADALKYWLEQGIQPANQPIGVPVQPSTDNRSCGNAPATRLSQGMRARVARSVNGQGRVRTGPSQDYQITKVVPVGTEFSVTGQPKCAGNSLWYPIQVDDGTNGWMMEGWTENFGPDYYLEPVGQTANNQSSQPVPPTAVPQTRISTTAIPATIIPQNLYQCAVAHAPGDRGWFPEAYAAETIGDGECVSYVKWYFLNKYGANLVRWGNQGLNCAHGDAKEWANTARVCGWPVDQTPMVGTIVVWQDNCPVNNKGDLLTGPAGHVAVVTQVQDKNNILVYEQNWYNPTPGPNHGPDHQVHGDTPYRIYPCMSFVHVPGTPGALSDLPKPSESNGIVTLKAVRVHIECLSCNPILGWDYAHDWVEFYTPNQEFMHKGFSVHLSYSPEAAVDWSLTLPANGVLVRLMLDSHKLGKIAKEEGLSLQQLSNPNAWYATYTK